MSVLTLILGLLYVFLKFDPDNLFGSLLLVGLVTIPYLFFTVYRYGGIIHNTSVKAFGEKINYLESLRAGLSSYPTLFITLLILCLIQLGLIFLFFLSGIGLLLVVVAMCILWLAPQAVVIDRVGVSEALTRSYEYLRREPFVFILAYILSSSVFILVVLGVATIFGIGIIASGFKVENLEPSTAILLVVVLCIIWTAINLYLDVGVPTQLYLEIRELENL